MSRYQPHELWQRNDGAWRMAFYTVVDQSRDGDYEEDDCDMYSFEAVYDGATADEAYDAATNEYPNPGWSHHTAHTGQNLETIARFEQMATEAVETALTRKADAEAHGTSYYGWIPDTAL